MQLGTAAKRRQTPFWVVCYRLHKRRNQDTRMRGTGSPFSVLFILFILDGNEAKNQLQHTALCNNEHMLRFNKMPHLGPRYFVQSLGTCVLCLRTWRTVFLIDMLPDANTDAPVEDGGGYSCFLNQSASPFSSIILVSRCPIFTSSSPCCVRDS